MTPENYIAVDLDCTLAEYHNGKWDTIGEPIPKMLTRVKRWLAKGITVKIMTARVAGRDAIPQRWLIEKWCVKHLGRKLEVTCCKDKNMLALWDDRAIQVEPNTGEAVGPVNEI